MWFKKGDNLYRMRPTRALTKNVSGLTIFRDQATSLREGQVLVVE
jgi:hypothetical protein